MTRTRVSRTIQAPVERVFATVSRIENFSRAVPHILNVEFLTENRSGVGTRFRETRVMNGKEASTELEVTEFVDNDHVRMVADSHGALWDSIFTVRDLGGATELELIMDARPYKLFPRLMIPLTRGFVQKALEQDMDAVKVYCEAGSAGSD